MSSTHFRCGTVDPATGAVSTKQPHGDDQEHHGFAAVAGGGTTDEPLLGEGDERAMVVEQSYTWVLVPGTDLEVRVLANRPVAGVLPSSPA